MIEGKTILWVTLVLVTGCWWLLEELFFNSFISEKEEEDGKLVVDGVVQSNDAKDEYDTKLEEE